MKTQTTPYRLFWLGLIALCLPLSQALQADDHEDDEDPDDYEDYEEHDEHDDEDWEILEEIPEERIVAFLKENHPARLEELREMQQDEPESYEEYLEELAWEIYEYVELLEEAPEYARLVLDIDRLEYRSYDLAESLAEAPEADRDTMERELRQVLNGIFDLKMRIHQMELAQLEQELEAYRHQLDRRAAAREEIIQRRFEQLLAEFDEALEW